MDEIKKISLDAVDRKLLAALEIDARIPVSSLARKARVSRAVAEYRLQQLQQKSVIRGYYCLLDPSKFGLTVWKLWVSLRAVAQQQRKEFFTFLEKNPHVWWYAECAGIYDAVVCVLAKSPHEFNSFFNHLQDSFGRMIANSSILINVSFEYHARGFLLHQPSQLIETSFQEKPLLKGRNHLDSLTAEKVKLLRLLSENSRIGYAELAQKTKLNVKTIKKALQELKKSGVIVYYRPSIDCAAWGFEFYKVLLTLHNPRGGIIPSIVHWCREQQNITAIIFCVGPWQLELEVEIDTFRNLCALLTRLKDQFPDIVKSYDTLLVTHEGSFQLDLMEKVERME